MNSLPLTECAEPPQDIASWEQNVSRGEDGALALELTEPMPVLGVVTLQEVSAKLDMILDGQARLEDQLTRFWESAKMSL